MAGADRPSAAGSGLMVRLMPGLRGLVQRGGTGQVGAEGRAGEEYLIVSRDGSVQLPAEVLEAALPPGTLVRAVPTADGVRLQRADPGDR